jgi:hypothetical protein
MTQLSERDLEFDFAAALKAVKFDDGITHAKSSVQAVDFIVEHADRYTFVEVKDPDEPGAANVEAFREKLKSGQLIRSLAGKFRDSLFFRVIQGVEKKPVEYIVLLSMAALTDADLLTKTDELKRSLPIEHSDWPENCATSCVIMNVRQWRRKFGDESLKRLSIPVPPAVAAPQVGA